MKCPICGGSGVVYKCDVCEEVRCMQNSCTGSMGKEKGNASSDRQCLACKKGRCKKIS